MQKSTKIHTLEQFYQATVSQLNKQDLILFWQFLKAYYLTPIQP